MMLCFTKMQALGNDFMVVDALSQPINLSEEKIRALADRRLGIGFDQLLLVEPATHSGADFYYRIFNADGSEAGHCGNGARCLAQFIQDQQLSNQRLLTLQIRDRLITTERLASGQIRVDMGKPDFLSDNEIDLGNRHTVFLVDDINKIDISLTTQAPENNREFMQIISRKMIKLRVWERGVGETPACGSGAVAAVAYGVQEGLLDPFVEVLMLGGQLCVEQALSSAKFYLIGGAETVFVGKLSLTP